MKIKRVTPRMGKDFVCGRFKKQVDGLMEPMEELCENAETGIGWVKFKECRELLNSKRFSLKMKGMVYQCCVRSAVLYKSEK